MMICSRGARRTTSGGSTRIAKSGIVSTSPWMRPSNLTFPTHAHLEGEVTQSPSQIVLDGDGLRPQ